MTAIGDTWNEWSLLHGGYPTPDEEPDNHPPLPLAPVVIAGGNGLRRVSERGGDQRIEMRSRLYKNRKADST